ncbi:MAG: 16S rRNA (cytidine(1402)-2'-O)-methyltransferase [Gammaproteobacteria bacterium]|nr:16S rRNA (cytidine(1402)-2'-O)-methyltransferase [Gammaproteobacteria bacterium]
MDAGGVLPYALSPSAATSVEARIIVAKPPAGRLYVVATPIGNLGDLSDRARRTLESAAVIAAEDTRHSAPLLRHFGIAKPLVSLHEHNELERAPGLVARLAAGEDVALISDAGTPAISDPGYALVRAAAAAGCEVIAVPGPCAAIAALSIAGLPTDRFAFEGFLPARAAARRRRLAAVADDSRTLVLYESPHRLGEMLGDCVTVLGAQRSAAVARELTKMHERVHRGRLDELASLAAQDPDLARGEAVVVIEGAAPREESAGAAELDRLLEPLLAELPLAQAARLAARISGLRDNEVYRRALALRAAGSEEPH